jgi:MFS family permease
LDAKADRPPAAPERRKRTVPALQAAIGAGCFQLAGQIIIERPFPAALLFAAALGLLAVGVPPLLPPGTFQLRRGLPTVIAMRGAMAGGFFGTETFLPLMLKDLRGLNSTEAGASLTGGALAWTFGAWLQSRLAARVHGARQLTAGFLFVVLGVALAAAATADSVPVVTAAVGWVFAGFGMGLGISSLGVLLLDLSPPHAHGANSAALQVSDAVGSSLLIGTGGAIYAAFRTGECVNAAPFLIIDAAMAGVLIAGAVAARRVRP